MYLETVNLKRATSAYVLLHHQVHTKISSYSFCGQMLNLVRARSVLEALSCVNVLALSLPFTKLFLSFSVEKPHAKRVCGTCLLH